MCTLQSWCQIKKKFKKSLPVWISELSNSPGCLPAPWPPWGWFSEPVLPEWTHRGSGFEQKRLPGPQADGGKESRDQWETREPHGGVCQAWMRETGPPRQRGRQDGLAWQRAWGKEAESGQGAGTGEAGSQCGEGKQGAEGAEAGGREKRAPTCCKVKVVRLRRCFLRRNPSSKSPAEWPPKGAAPAGREPR